jgi:hypothetical protein
MDAFYMYQYYADDMLQVSMLSVLASYNKKVQLIQPLHA